jgi:hypothetical protein
MRDVREADGEVFATASVPMEHIEPLIAQIRAAAAVVMKRPHAAPARRQ